VGPELDAHARPLVYLHVLLAHPGPNCLAGDMLENARGKSYLAKIPSMPACAISIPAFANEQQSHQIRNLCFESSMLTIDVFPQENGALQ
jgi:hypothetical protein